MRQLRHSSTDAYQPPEVVAGSTSDVDVDGEVVVVEVVDVIEVGGANRMSSNP